VGGATKVKRAVRSGGRRSGAETRAALLEAARRRFAECGYGGATVRQIASDAGVDAAMVIRYFGSKEALFFEAAKASPDVVQEIIRTAPRERLGEELIRATASHWAEAEPTLVALLRSGGLEEAGELLRRRLRSDVRDQMLGLLEGEDAPLRAELAAAVMVGLLTVRAMLPDGEIAAADPERLARSYGPTLQAALFGAASAEPASA